MVVNHAESRFTKPPRVSIIVPMYEVEDYIEECIKSVIAQTESSWELILVDDGSPDGSGSIAAQYAQADVRIQAIRQENKGVSAARNIGLERACGEFVCFIDGDDWLAPDFLSHMLQVAGATSTDYVISTRVLGGDGIRGDHEPLKLWTSAEALCALLYAEIPIGCWNKLFRRSMIEKAGLRFLTEYRMGEGLNFITRAAQLCGSVAATSHPAYHYRRDNPRSATTAVTVLKMENAIEAIDRIRQDLVFQESSVRAALAYQYLRTGFSGLSASLREGNFSAAQRFRAIVRAATIAQILSVKVRPANRLAALAVRLLPVTAARLRNQMRLLRRSRARTLR